MIKNILIASILMTVSNAWAQGETPVRKNDKLDIQKLEQKYWAAKDDDFSVVQNRKYTKADRLFLSLTAGSPFNDPYSDGTYLGASVGYFFNERWGLELSYSKASFKDNDATEQFKTENGTSPDYNTIDSTYFLTGSFVPFYAKMSVMDKAIIYFDMGLNLGLGMNNYHIARDIGKEAKSSPALKLGIFQQIFFSEHFAIRADFNNVWSKQTKSPFSQASTRADRDEVINDSSIMIGLTYWH